MEDLKWSDFPFVLVLIKWLKRVQFVRSFWPLNCEIFLYLRRLWSSVQIKAEANSSISVDQETHRNEWRRENKATGAGPSEEELEEEPEEDQVQVKIPGEK